MVALQPCHESQPDVDFACPCVFEICGSQDEVTQAQTRSIRIPIDLEEEKQNLNGKCPARSRL